jgi:hypothetical protein
MLEADANNNGSINVDSFVRILNKTYGEWSAWSLILIYFLLEHVGQAHPAACGLADPCMMIGKGARIPQRSHITQLSDPSAECPYWPINYLKSGRDLVCKLSYPGYRNFKWLYSEQPGYNVPSEVPGDVDFVT